MLGNSDERCHDWYEETYPGDVTDPWGPASATARVIRGGSWHGFASGARAARRSFSNPTTKGTSLGFRLASSST